MNIDRDDCILVTGGSGFLGRHVVKALTLAGYSNVPAFGSKPYDFTDPEAVQCVYHAHRPKVVIHLAAVVGGIGANQKEPGKFFRDNLLMGMHLIDFARSYGVEKFVQIGTVCSYPKFTIAPFSEHNLWDGYPEKTNAPYGIAKKALLVMLQAYRQQYGLNGIYLIPTNLYGPDDNFDLETSHVIPAIIRKMDEAIKNNSNKVVLWGTGRATREFLYVEDCAYGILRAMEQYDGAEPVNLGSEDRDITIYELAARIASLMGYEGEIVFDPTRPDGQPRRMVDTHLAQQLFGWESETDLEDGLRKTIDWYKETNPCQ